MNQRITLMVLIVGLFLAREEVAVASEQTGDTLLWPTTLDTAFKDILFKMSDYDKEMIRGLDREDLIRYHHGWGTGIRNTFGLWRGNDDLIISACKRRCHPDTASMHIIEAVWEMLQE